MRADIKDRWLKALESGEYNLGKNHLYNYDNDTHCPLGVLVELAMDDGVEIKVKSSETYNGEKVALIDGSHGMLEESSPLFKWAGMDHRTANIIANNNDTRGSEYAVYYIRNLVTGV